MRFACGSLTVQGVIRMKLKHKTYSLAEAFGPGFPSDLSVTGYEPSNCRFVPRVESGFRWDRSLLRDLVVWWEHGGCDPVHLFGPTGSGKSSALRNFCGALKIPMYERTFHPQLEFNELVSVVDLIDGSTITSYSHLPLAMGADGWPGLFVANEIDRADPGTVIGLNEILQGQPLCMHLGGLDPVDPAPGFRIAMTGNSAMSGDMVGGYVSVRQQDSAFADRPWFLKVSYPEPAVEEEILSAAVPDLSPPVRTKMIEVANDIRAAYMGTSSSDAALPITMSTRSLRRWANLTHLFHGARTASLNPIAYALDRALLYRVDGQPEVRRAVLELVQGKFGDAHGAFT